ncbi:hypothetical protein [Halovivax sp.]|uniref:hypothetical protein n=1 Tax=Halovivax sp. TaxID=1935978 RepID=UPI0025BEE368|nr:hypothetical protein [Halovivax sp.]
MAGEPIEGQALVLAAAKASVPSTRLPDLIDVAQAELEARVERYRREYEELDVSADELGVQDEVAASGFLVEGGHWETLGEELGFDRRESDAVRRAHEEQLLRIGRRRDRAEEFDAALEIREPVFVAEGGG